MPFVNDIIKIVNENEPLMPWTSRNISDGGTRDLIKKIRHILNHLSGNKLIPMLNDIMHDIEKNIFSNVTDDEK